MTSFSYTVQFPHQRNTIDSHGMESLSIYFPRQLPSHQFNLLHKSAVMSWFFSLRHLMNNSLLYGSCYSSLIFLYYQAFVVIPVLPCVVISAIVISHCLIVCTNKSVEIIPPISNPNNLCKFGVCVLVNHLLKECLHLVLWIFVSPLTWYNRCCKEMRKQKTAVR